MTAKPLILTSLLVTAAGFLASLALADRDRIGRSQGREGTVSGTVSIGDESGARRPAGAGVVVYFESAPALDARTEPVVRRIGQKDRRFTPALTVIPRGGTVEFPNDDRVFHNVFSLSSTQRFDLGLYRDGDSRSVTFKRPGVIDVYCNIHPEMKARIKVVPNAFHAITDDKGGFRITGVPAGTYTLVAWNGHEVRASVTLGRGQTTVQDFRLAPPPRTRRHLRKDSTPYRRY
jgi:plastocyanin